jgi:hypothetical protein
MSGPLKLNEVEVFGSKAPERRIDHRELCSLPASISLNDMFICHCAIKDISVSGLRLFVPSASWLPHEFTLESKALGMKARVSTRWKNADEVGVSQVGE